MKHAVAFVFAIACVRITASLPHEYNGYSPQGSLAGIFTPSEDTNKAPQNTAATGYDTSSLVNSASEVIEPSLGLLGLAPTYTQPSNAPSVITEISKDGENINPDTANHTITSLTTTTTTTEPSSTTTSTTALSPSTIISTASTTSPSSITSTSSTTTSADPPPPTTSTTTTSIPSITNSSVSTTNSTTITTPLPLPPITTTTSSTNTTNSSTTISTTKSAPSSTTTKITTTKTPSSFDTIRSKTTTTGPLSTTTSSTSETTSTKTNTLDASLKAKSTNTKGIVKENPFERQGRSKNSSILSHGRRSYLQEENVGSLQGVTSGKASTDPIETVKQVASVMGGGGFLAVIKLIQTFFYKRKHRHDDDVEDDDSIASRRRRRRSRSRSTSRSRSSSALSDLSHSVMPDMK